MRLIIACKMLEDEVNAALSQVADPPPVVWLERGLHEQPERLRQVLQETIDRFPGREILLAYGLCGNALDGVGSDTSTLVVPRFDDCLHLLLADQPGEKPLLDCRTLYFTDGWLRSDRFIVREYEACLAQYGQEMTEDIFAAMLSGYRHLCLIDTGCFPLCPAHRQAENAADLLHLELVSRTGTLRILHKLFSGQWDEEFLIARPGQRFSQLQFLFR